MMLGGSAENNGWLSRSDWEWTKRLWKKDDRERVVYEVDGRIEGYLVIELTWEATDISASVVEWVWISDRAWRGLAGMLGSLSEQARFVRFNAARHDPLLHALREPYDFAGQPAEFVFFQSARLLSGFMLRVVHLPAALSQRRYPLDVSANFILQVKDAQLPANTSPLQVRIAGGAAQVTPIDVARHLPPDIRTTISGFSELYAGLVSAEQLRTMGRLRADDAICAALTAAFAAAPLSMWSADWF